MSCVVFVTSIVPAAKVNTSYCVVLEYNVVVEK